MSSNATDGHRKVIIVKDIRASNLKFRHIFRYSVAIQLGTYLVRTPRVTASDDKTARWNTSLELIIEAKCGVMELWIERSTPFKRGFRIAKTSVQIDMKELLPKLSYDVPLTREFKFASAEVVISFLIKDEEADGDDFAMVSFSKYTVDDFEVLGLIGRGAFGEVLRVKVISTGKIYAMKIVRKADLNDQLSVSAIQAERDIMLGVQHPFICRLHAAMGTQHHLCFVLDLLPGKDLAFHMRKTSPLPPNRAKLYAGCVALALNHLHEHGFIYRDLKSENIVLDCKGYACLTDFGMAKGGLAGSLRTYTTCGTPEYISPEILLGKAYAKEVDWWALGVLIYEMLVGSTPFYCTSANAVYQRIVKEEVKFPDTIDPYAKELIEQLLIKDQKQRLADGNQIMALRYFNGLNFNSLLNKTLSPDFVPEPEEEPPPTTLGFLVLSEYLKQQRSPKNRYLADQLEGFSFYPVEVSS